MKMITTVCRYTSVMIRNDDDDKDASDLGHWPGAMLFCSQAMMIAIMPIKQRLADLLQCYAVVADNNDESAHLLRCNAMLLMMIEDDDGQDEWEIICKGLHLEVMIHIYHIDKVS